MVVVGIVFFCLLVMVMVVVGIVFFCLLVMVMVVVGMVFLSASHGSGWYGFFVC